MLDRLARWLRLLGADAAAWTGDDEDDLLALLRGESRLFVTRHRRRAARLALRNLAVLRLDANDLSGQLREVAARFALPPVEARFTRCAHCNAFLREAAPAEAAAWVPPFVAQTQTRFSRCPSCSRVFWRGTHPGRFERDLARLLGTEP
ncbi:MAG: hypothetical protein HY907_04605 [Deltaproteobacteria bacterium]|nr:hypothetical protein [Deltaproteobacteria bacterium]